MFISKFLTLPSVAILAMQAIPQESASPAKLVFSPFSPEVHALHSSCMLSMDTAAVLEACDSVAGCCTMTSKHNCPCETHHLVGCFFEPQRRQSRHVCARAAVGNNIRCIRTEEEFLDRAYEEVKRDVVLMLCTCPAP
ncbi:hypothetical protein B0H10DRAFT_2224309 [Mycena sp. CBHHK59/15]|nr:hypothetical protein B0H10DRAFT_2224309 [Mycena sp. CBHHK59/15]